MFSMNISPVPPQIIRSDLYISTYFFIYSLSSLKNLSISESSDVALPGVFFKFITKIGARYFSHSFLSKSSTLS